MQRHVDRGSYVSAMSKTISGCCIGGWLGVCCIQSAQDLYWGVMRQVIWENLKAHMCFVYLDTVVDLEEWYGVWVRARDTYM